MSLNGDFLLDLDLLNILVPPCGRDGPGSPLRTKGTPPRGSLAGAGAEIERSPRHGPQVFLNLHWCLKQPQGRAGQIVLVENPELRIFPTATRTQGDLV